MTTLDSSGAMTMARTRPLSIAGAKGRTAPVAAVTAATFDRGVLPMAVKLPPM